jgi:CyaY protein
MKNFDLVITDLLQNISDALERDGGDDIDIIESDGMLTITTLLGVFVINRQSVMQEVWLSSPITGPYHFAYKDANWVDKNNNNLLTILEKELKIHLTL